MPLGELENGRPASTSCADFQLGVIDIGVEGGMGYRKIAKEYAPSGIAAAGAKWIVKKLKNGGGLFRDEGSGRSETGRTPRDVKEVAQIVEDDPVPTSANRSHSLGRSAAAPAISSVDTPR